ncbi:MAG: branched-chain amino acid transporter permease, partial [Oscillospiraceae bacterium]|nr:branched-chain amino acid transporter permease [Oscillospiraceae bacterium]
MPDNRHALLLVAVIAAVTAAIRFLPFLLFQKKTPRAVLYLGSVLPNAIMGMLVVYCLRHVSLSGGSHGIPEAAAILVVWLLHRWKHNTLLSILAGTAAYMLLVQFLFRRQKGAPQKANFAARLFAGHRWSGPEPQQRRKNLEKF